MTKFTNPSWLPIILISMIDTQKLYIAKMISKTRYTNKLNMAEIISQLVIGDSAL